MCVGVWTGIKVYTWNTKQNIVSWSYFLVHICNHAKASQAGLFVARDSSYRVELKREREPHL